MDNKDFMKFLRHRSEGVMGVMRVFCAAEGVYIEDFNKSFCSLKLNMNIPKVNIIEISNLGVHLKNLLATRGLDFGVGAGLKSSIFTWSWSRSQLFLKPAGSEPRLAFFKHTVPV